jgi:chromate reductase
MQQPEAYLSFVDKSLDEKGHVNNESTLAFLNKFILAFSDWVQRHTTYDIIKETMALSS